VQISAKYKQTGWGHAAIWMDAWMKGWWAGSRVHLCFRLVISTSAAADVAAAAAGPQFFGFTDLNVRLAIAVQYTPAELAYVQHGVALPAAAQQQQQQLIVPQQQEQQMDKHQQQQQLQQEPHPVRPALQQLSPAELFARELECSFPGVGAATAAVLATTTCLGGVQHGSLAGLKQWLAADDRHREQLQAFLLNRCAAGTVYNRYTE
jgi:hypothetical protein